MWTAAVCLLLTIALVATSTLSVNQEWSQQWSTTSESQEWTRRLYTTYLNRFNKSLSRLQVAEHRDRFLMAVNFVYAHNRNQLLLKGNESALKAEGKRVKGKRRHRLRLTQFADMTDTELRAVFSSVPDTHQFSSVQRRGTATTAETADEEQLPELLKQDFIALWGMLFDEDSVASSPKGQSLNWASADNPLRQAVLSHVHNQGGCGACWAFVSSSLTQAMVALELLQSSQTSTNTPVVASVPRLSAQQLVDCDTGFNRGCFGGNPFVALDYVIEHGLVAESVYPYNAHQNGVCAARDRRLQAEESRNDSSSLLQSSRYRTARYFVSRRSKVGGYDEAAMLRALQRGPISVGVCGTDMSFLYYSSGIYDEEDCCLLQNHAMLIVGHGYDAELDLEFWIALNSWGELWGERGFMRIAKGGELRSMAGVCGINVDPVQAVGGYVLGANGQLITPVDPRGNNGTAAANAVSSWRYYCDRLWYYWSSHWVEVSVVCSALLMLLSFLMLIYSFYLDRLFRMKSRLRASALGYSELEMSEENLASHPQQQQRPKVSRNSYQGPEC